MAKPLSLLLADDDLDDCFMFEKALKELPLESNLKTVYDGDELLNELSLNDPQLPAAIFLDLNMPRLNGIGCLEAIKKNRKLQGIPVIIFSTSIHHTLAGKLIEMGAKKCIRKPSTFPELKTIISNILSELHEEGRS